MALAAVLGPAIGELGTLLGGSGIGAILGRGAVAGIGAVAAADLIKAISGDLKSGNPQAISQARRVPQYAIVDLHNNQVIRTLSSRHVYTILTHPRRKGSRRGHVRVITAPAGSEIVTVR